VHRTKSVSVLDHEQWYSVAGSLYAPLSSSQFVRQLGNVITPDRSHRQTIVTTKAAETLIQAFISYWLDYCNSLLYGMRKLQSIKNVAARLITGTVGTRQCDHIAHVPRQLHWLPVRWRVEYKVVVHQLLSGLTTVYLADDINLVADSDRHLLRSLADSTARVVPRSLYT